MYVKWEKGQDEPWILVSNLDCSVDEVCSLYASRWEIEEMFESLKNQVPITPIGVIGSSKRDSFYSLLGLMLKQ